MKFINKCFTFKSLKKKTEKQSYNITNSNKETTMITKKTNLLCTIDGLALKNKSETVFLAKFVLSQLYMVLF